MYHLYIRKVYSNAIINIPSQRPENSGLGLKNRGFLGALPQKASDGQLPLLAPCPSCPTLRESHTQTAQPTPTSSSHTTLWTASPHSQRSTASMADPREDDGKGRHSLAGWSGLLRTRMQKRRAAVRRGDAGSGWAYLLGFPEKWEFA